MQDLIANVTINVLRITFSKNNTVSRSTANDWVNGILENDLRSIKLAKQALKMTIEYGRDSNRRILAYRLGAMCGNVSTRVSFFLLFTNHQISCRILSGGNTSESFMQKGIR